MATTLVTGSKNEVTVVHSNPAMPPLHPGAGVPVVAAAKTAGQPNGQVHGQVPASAGIPVSVIIHNPA